MKERPILFKTEMVKAILEGRKTQTRRVVKINIRREIEGNSPTCFSVFDKSGLQYYNKKLDEPLTAESFCPFGEVGEILWVKETWSPLVVGGGKNFDLISYKANGDIPSADGWEPSLFMPKSACRLKLRITNIRCERLNDITEEDAKKEGVEPIENGYKQYIKTRLDKVTEYASYSFMTLWESINGKDSWKKNPWVWVIEFEAMK